MFLLACLILYLSFTSQLRDSFLCEDFYNLQRLDSVPSYVIPGTTCKRAGGIMVVNLQRAVKHHLGAKYRKCSKRNNVLHIKTSLGVHTAWNRKESYNKQFGVGDSSPKRYDRQTFSIQSHTPTPCPIPRIQKYMWPFCCCCWCQYGWEQPGGGRVVIMPEDSPLQGRILLPQMLMTPLLRNPVLRGMQMREQRWIAPSNTVEAESWHFRTSISTYSPCRVLPHL